MRRLGHKSYRGHVHHGARYPFPATKSEAVEMLDNSVHCIAVAAIRSNFVIALDISGTERQLDALSL